MSQIVEFGETIYLSGQVPKDTSGNIQQQTASVLEKIEGLLASVNSSKENLLSATIYLKAMDDFSDFNKIWDGWFQEANAPVRTCVEARLARPQVLVEITIIATR